MINFLENLSIDWVSRERDTLIFDSIKFERNQIYFLQALG